MTELLIAKAKINQEHVGGFFLIPTDEMSFEEMQKIPVGEVQICTIKEITDKRKRVVEQTNLYFACCKLVADNTDDIYWNTKEKADEQTRLTCGFVEYEIHHYDKKTDQITVHRKTKSLSFSKLTHMDACGYYSDAFPVLAEKINLTVDELVAEAQARMKGAFYERYNI